MSVILIHVLLILIHFVVKDGVIVCVSKWDMFLFKVVSLSARRCVELFFCLSVDGCVNLRDKKEIETAI